MQERLLAYPVVAVLFILSFWLPNAGPVRAQSVPSGIVYSVPMAITNNQGAMTSNTFTQMVTVDFRQYSPYADSNLQNVEFFAPDGQVIPSWLESGGATSNATFWLKVGSISANGVVRIFMGFASPSANLFGGPLVGEAPELSPAYGQYDNGANVFPFYDNFHDNVLGSDWVNNSAASGNTVSVSNGLLIGPTSTTNNKLAVYSKYNFTTPGVVEFQTTVRVSASAFSLGVGLMSPVDPLKNNIAIGSIGGPARGLWTTDNGSYNCMANPQFGLDFNTSYIYSVAVSQSPSSTVTATVDYNRGSALSTFRDIPAFPLSIGFLDGGRSPGVLGPTDWVRVRAYPPNGVMPMVTFLSSSSSASSSSASTSGQTQSGAYNQTQSWFSVSCEPASVGLGSSTVCTAGGHSLNGTAATGVVSWTSSAPGSFSPAQQCTLSRGMCAISYTPSSTSSPVKIVALYSGDSQNPQANAGFMLDVYPSTGVLTTVTLTTGSVTTVTTSTIASGGPTCCTTTRMTTTTVPTLPSLPSFALDPVVPLGVVIAMIVVAVAAAVNWLRRKGENPSPAQAPEETIGPATPEGSGR